MKRFISLAALAAIVATSCSSGSEEITPTTAPLVGATAVEATWCGDFNNFPAIALAAISAEVEGFEIIEAERVRIVDGLGESFLDTFLGGFLELEWKAEHTIGYTAACKAAYEQR